MLDNRLNIVIYALSARRGGGITYLHNLLDSIVGDDYFRVTIIALETLDLGLCDSKINKKILPNAYGHPIFRAMWETLFLRRFLKTVDAQVFFCPGGILPSVSLFAPWKTVTMFRNMIPFDKRQRVKYPLGYMRVRNYLLEILIKKSLRRADLVIFISNYAKHYLVKSVGLAIKKSVTIPHGISEKFSAHAKVSESFGLDLDKEFIFYPSIIDVYKSQIEVIQAYSILKEEGVKLPKLVLAGEIYGKYGRDVVERVSVLGLHSEIILSGPINYFDMPRYYANSSMVLFASQCENCPNILLESMASGKAILCSNIQPMPEFASDAVLYFDPSSPKHLAEKIKLLLSDFELRRALEIKALERSKLFRWDRTMSLTAAALKSVE